MYRHNEYHIFKYRAMSQPTDEIWDVYRTGDYFKLLTCQQCRLPGHEDRRIAASGLVCGAFEEGYRAGAADEDHREQERAA